MASQSHQRPEVTIQQTPKPLSRVFRRVRVGIWALPSFGRRYWTSSTPERGTDFLWTCRRRGNEVGFVCRVRRTGSAGEGCGSCSEGRYSDGEACGAASLAEILDIVNGTDRTISAVLTLKYQDLRLDQGPHSAIRWPLIQTRWAKNGWYGSPPR